MVLFICVTCSEKLDENEMLKHLSSTRHKTVVYVPLDEQIECEECQDSNIHMLSIIRYGGSDMALLCNTCLAKEEKPSTQYTLANGSILKNCSNYFKFRDISCVFCDTDEGLNVGIEGGKQIIVCNDCLKKNFASNSKFTNENDDKFAFEVLGIKEYVPPAPRGRGRGSSRGGRGRKTGRRGGSKGARGGRGGSRGGKSSRGGSSRGGSRGSSSRGSSSRGGSTRGGSIRGGSSRGDSSRGGSSRGRDNAHSRGGRLPDYNHREFTEKSTTTPTRTPDAFPQLGTIPEPKQYEGVQPSQYQQQTGTLSEVDSKGEQNRRAKSNSKKDAQLEAITEAMKKLKADGIVSNVDVKSPKTVSSDKDKIQKSDKTKGKKDSAPIDISAKTKKDKNSDKKNGITTSTKTSANKDAKTKVSSNGKIVGKFATGSNAINLPKRDERPASKVKEQVASSKNAIDLPKRDERPASKVKEQVASSKELIKLPAGISKYIPSPEPRLTYDSTTQYFQEMCYNLFLEEKISIEPITNFSVDWHQEQNLKHKKFKLNFPYDTDLQNRVSKRLQQVGKLPFSMNQSIVLMLGDDITWYGFVVDMDVKKTRGGQVIELKIELYQWNTQPLPLGVPKQHLSVLPFSVPVSRVLFAMARISNQSFIDMLLGKTPIRQINFNNFLRFSKPTFNDSQKVAIQSVLNNKITLIQGPPGTGKTSSIYEIIIQLLENLSTFPILVVAASNIAIDNIAEKLMPNHERDILRIVSNEKESEYNENHELFPITLHHKVNDDLPENFKQTQRDFRNPFVKVGKNSFKKLVQKQGALADKFIAQAKVIFTTTVVAGGFQLKSVKKMPVVIMDESTQSSEPTTLIPLSMPGVDKFVFVGDQKQLSAFSQIPSLQLSLFERVLLNGSYRQPHMLNVQYRMHPRISEFPIKKFYNNLLKDGLTAEDRTREGIDKPVYFWDTKSEFAESRVRNRFSEEQGFTYQNDGEADLIIQVLTKLIYEKSVDRSTIGVITPYRAQRDLLSKKISENELVNPEKDEVHVEVDRDDFFNETKPITIHTVAGIMIASIDAFQGREKDFILFSCVRSNPNNNIGFLKDERRLNVALTRARYGLVMVGDVSCLIKGDKLWEEFLTELEKSNCIYTSKEFTY